MSGLQFDFIVYLGDPDEGAEAISSQRLLDEAEQYKAQVKFPDVYGAITIEQGGEDLIPPQPDTIYGLITNFVRAVQYVIEGDPETLRFSESEHGFAFEPNGEDVMISMFYGDPFEPEEFLLQPEAMRMEDFAEQVLAMGDRLRKILEKTDKERLESDDYLKGLSEFLEVSGDVFKTMRLEKQRGLRPT